MVTRHKFAYVLDVLSNDRPGIVSSVSNSVEDLGGNIDACSQTVLSGYFTLIMVVSFADEIDTDLLVSKVRAGDERTGYAVLVRPFVRMPTPAEQHPVERFVITAFGGDKPGIVRRFSEYLAGKDINIVDLYGDRRGDDFVLISEVEIPKRWDIGMLQADLEQMGGEIGFTVRLQHENVFVATNQLRLKR